MKNNQKYSIIILACLLASCNYDCPQIPDSYISNDAIVFTGKFSKGIISKGQTELIDSTIYTMGVFAGYEDEDESFGCSSLANDFINNVRYSRSFLNKPFAGEEVCYWPFSGKLSFFAYAPYVSSNFLKFSSDYVAGYPRMEYSPTTDVIEQPDFCLASPVLDKHITTEPIPLVFSHTLSQILFSAGYTGHLPVSSSTLYVKIDSIRIHNIIAKKTVSMSSGDPCFEWQADSTCIASDRISYHIDRSGKHQIINDSLRLGNYLNISSTDGIMYLLPQGMNYGEAYLTVSFGYYELVNTQELLRSSVTAYCPLPEVIWEPAHAYRYRFLINLANNSIVNPSVSVESWQDINNTGSNPNHIE